MASINLGAPHPRTTDHRLTTACCEGGVHHLSRGQRRRVGRHRGGQGVRGAGSSAWNWTPAWPERQANTTDKSCARSQPLVVINASQQRSHIARPQQASRSVMAQTHTHANTLAQRAAACLEAASGGSPERRVRVVRCWLEGRHTGSERQSGGVRVWGQGADTTPTSARATERHARTQGPASVGKEESAGQNHNIPERSSIPARRAHVRTKR